MTPSNGNPMIWYMYHGWLTPIIAHCYHLLKNAYKSHEHEQQFFNELVMFYMIFFPRSVVWLVACSLARHFVWRCKCQSWAMIKFKNYLTCVYERGKMTRHTEISDQFPCNYRFTFIAFSVICSESVNLSQLIWFDLPRKTNLLRDNELLVKAIHDKTSKPNENGKSLRDINVNWVDPRKYLWNEECMGVSVAQIEHLNNVPALEIALVKVLTELH